jgi:calcineurin-like phosphoesterase family protein
LDSATPKIYTQVLTLPSYLPAVTQIVVIVSGDIAFSGEQSEYELANTFLREIGNTITNECGLPLIFIVTPGNHDCDFKLNNATRKLLLKQIADSDLADLDNSVIDACTTIQQAFFQFRGSLESSPIVDDDKLWRTTRLTIGNKVVAIDCLNVSWTSELHEEPARLYFPLDRYTAKALEPTPDLRIVVMHHPLNWFAQSMYRPFRTFIRQVGDIIITGHEHQGNVGTNIDAETAKSTYIEGCVLQRNDRSLKDSSYNVGMNQ